MSDGKIVSLNKVRKVRTRADRKARADENAVRFGLTKDQKAAERARAEKARRALDGHERDGE